MILLVLGVFIFVGRSTVKPRGTAVQTPGVLQTQSAPAASLPSRPLIDPFDPPARAVGEDPVPTIGDCEVVSILWNGRLHYRLRAQVLTTPHRRVLLTGYFLDSFGYSVRGQEYGTSNRDGTLCAGAWVFGQDEVGAELHKVEVVLLVPVSAARTTPASVQISLFDEHNEELARRNVTLMPIEGTRRPY